VLPNYTCGLGDSVDSIATHYGLDRLRDRIPVGAGFLDFVHHPDRPWPTQAYWVSFLRVKRLGHGVDYPFPSSVEVKGRVELYLYSSSVPSWPAVG